MKMSTLFLDFLFLTTAILFPRLELTGSVPADSGAGPNGGNAAGSNNTRGSATSPKANNGINPNTTTTESPFSYLHQLCGFEIEGAKDCDPTANLICDGFEPTAWSNCQCAPGFVPDHFGNPVCKLPKRIIEVGGKCNPNATRLEEECRGVLAICAQNGTCICRDDESNQVLYDDEHKYCYMKTEGHHRLKFINQAASFSNDATTGLISVASVLNIVSDLLN